MLVGLKSLSALFLDVLIIVDSHPLPVPTPCYATKSSLTKLDLVVQPGGELLLDWLVKAKSFTTSLQTLDVWYGDQIPQSSVPLVSTSVQALLDNCIGHLNEWHFVARLPTDEPASVPHGNVDLTVSIATDSDYS